VLDPNKKKDSQDLLITDSNVHVLMLLKEQSSLQINLKFEPNEKESSLKIEVELKDGAELQLSVELSKGISKTSVIQRCRVGSNAILKLKNITLGELVEQDLVCEANGTNATSDIEWVFHAKSKDKQKLSVRNVFNKENGKGEVTLKGVSEDQAYVSLNGLIEVGTQGGGSDVFLREDILMLDPNAKVDTVPSLEIKNDDVKASHSASIRRISPEELFYFASRGVDQEKTRRMYINGFLSNS